MKQPKQQRIYRFGLIILFYATWVKQKHKNMWSMGESVVCREFRGASKVEKRGRKTRKGSGG